MKKLLKKGLIFGAVYLILLLCTFIMSNRIERLEEVGNNKTSSISLFSLKVNR